VGKHSSFWLSSAGSEVVKERGEFQASGNGPVDDLAADPSTPNDEPCID
jgi:hypothetical protein